jgi:hypothetical protein
MIAQLKADSTQSFCEDTLKWEKKRLTVMSAWLG